MTDTGGDSRRRGRGPRVPLYLQIIIGMVVGAIVGPLLGARAAPLGERAGDALPPLPLAGEGRGEGQFSSVA